MATMNRCKVTNLSHRPIAIPITESYFECDIPHFFQQPAQKPYNYLYNGMDDCNPCQIWREGDTCTNLLNTDMSDLSSIYSIYMQVRSVGWYRGTHNQEGAVSSTDLDGSICICGTPISSV
jgi:hypothetical protein